MRTLKRFPFYALAKKKRKRTTRNLLMTRNENMTILGWKFKRQEPSRVLAYWGTLRATESGGTPRGH